MHSRQKQRSKRVRARADLLTLIAATILATGCDRKAATQPAAKQPSAAPLTIYTTLYPTAYFAERIAGDLAKIVNGCPPDADPAFWTPDEQTIVAYQKADLIVVNVPSFEQWVTNVSLPPSRVVVTTRPFEDELIMIEHTVYHSHGPEGGHSHEGVDGHTWLDPINAKAQAGEILKALVKLRSEHKAAFEEGYATLAKDLDELDARLREVTRLIGDNTLLCSHPAYNYLGKRYGWTLVNFDLDPRLMPDEEALADVREHVVKDFESIMLWESQPTTEIIRAMTNVGVWSVVFSPCEVTPERIPQKRNDYLRVMQLNTGTLGSRLRMMAIMQTGGFPPSFDHWEDEPNEPD